MWVNQSVHILPSIQARVQPHLIPKISHRPSSGPTIDPYDVPGTGFRRDILSSRPGGRRLE